MRQIIPQLIPIFLVILGLITGKIIEKRHLRRLAQKESYLREIRLSNLRNIPEELSFKRSFLVTGSVVIATDYFKVWAAWLRGIFGGEMRTYRSLMSRARREAIVRMLEQAHKDGADSVYNIRFETMTIGGKKKAGGVEVLVYGTAVKTT
jgi:uncharacterized protein YbjQ (UPF0145 family)